MAAAKEEPFIIDIQKSIVARVVKNKVTVPITNEARIALNKSIGVFILYLTSTANEIVNDANRSTLTAKDVFEALDETDFQQFIPKLKLCLQEYREFENTKKAAKKTSNALVSAMKQQQQKNTPAASAAPAVAVVAKNNDVDEDDDDNVEDVEKSKEQ